MDLSYDFSCHTASVKSQLPGKQVQAFLFRRWPHMQTLSALPYVECEAVDSYEH